ncbi:isoleucyl-tRNA synthetase [Cenarchaeum symbiosum A]|uniref:Isoleucine--tRNA ligase n=1 Tax=Cenarchaeum symbiosum (strain A) TaxID=414004 RepID=A0RTU0_CENSY|nr:isoleucyl-tRNA synthetase [Cenarchaeum symbiosum A]
MELREKYDPKGIEEEVRSHLEGADLDRMIAESGNREEVMFIEGPPTMNGPPHAGHLRGRVIKDLWYRYNTLRGKRVIFNAGWDTQGLPVELQVQKELGVAEGKSELVESMGIEKLVAECKALVGKYQVQWKEADRLLGVSLNQDKAYWTYRDDFIEREWQVLKKANERGILEVDFTVIAYCPSCQASLSHAEVNQGYEEVSDPSLYYKVKLDDRDVYLIIWTTMPFTLVTDAMVGLHPDEDYNHVRVGDETWIVGATRTAEFFKEVGIEEYSIEKSSKGSEFEGLKYVHPLYEEVPALRELSGRGYHVAVSEEFVDASTGSGLVHLSPANGEEDIKIAHKRGVEIFCPIDDEVKFTPDAGKYSGLFVRDADRVIVEDLKERGALVRIGKLRHKYPLCWRSHHRIVWLARRGWFYKLGKLGSEVVDAAESVEYFFEQPRNRFLGIVKEKHPWCISRERFWGCPLPVWNCTDCKNRNWLYSRQEIEAAAAEPPGKFELHRPWIDEVKIKCSKCGGTNTKREQFVLDTWHNSGSAPFSSLTDNEYVQHIPAPFFTEGIDQTRGWAYTLLVENVIMSGSSPYKSFLFQGHVLDKKGNKMSKSLGNMLEAGEMLREHPADLVRFYLMWKASPIEPLSFDANEMMSRPYQVLSTLYHLHLYFKQNSEYDGYGGGTAAEAKTAGLLRPPDIWILSKLQGLIRDAAGYSERCRLHEYARSLESFIINMLSQVYVPIVRGELWDEDDSKKDRRMAIYAVISEVLQALDVMLHPISPYTTEYLYQGVFRDKQSILLEGWPREDPLLEDRALEESFDLLRDAASAAAAARMKGKLKRRWPLVGGTVCVGSGQMSKIMPLYDLLLSQINLEKCDIVEVGAEDDLGYLLALKRLGLPVSAEIKLDRKAVGPRAGRLMGGLVSAFEGMGREEIIASFEGYGSLKVDVEGKEITLGPGDITVKIEAGEGFVFARHGDAAALISIYRSKELLAKGLVKDLARRLQKLRKDRAYRPTDMLEQACIDGLDPEQIAMIKERKDELAFLVRVNRIEIGGSCAEYSEEEMDGQKIRISVE